MEKILNCIAMKFWIALAFLSSTLCANLQLPFPYCDLEETLPFNAHGWYSNAQPMEVLLKSRKAKVVIELGAWLGLSTRHIATTLPEDGIVYAVDHWLGNPQSQNNPIIPILYEQFLSNVIHANLTHKIVPIRMTTLDAVKFFESKGIIPDVVYVDAAHDEESVYSDLTAYFPLVKGHGILCGDDWGYGHELPVQKAVKRFAEENNLKIITPNNWFWEFRENSH